MIEFLTTETPSKIIIFSNPNPKKKYNFFFNNIEKSSMKEGLVCRSQVVWFKVYSRKNLSKNRIYERKPVPE